MAAINEKAIGKYSGIAYFRPAGTTVVKTRLASVRGLTAKIDSTDIKKILADDTGEIYAAANVVGSMELTFLENFNRDILSMLFSGTQTNVLGVLQNQTDVIASGFVFDELNELTKANSDGSLVTITSVTGSVDGVLASSNYSLVKVNGKTLISIKDTATVTTTAQTITVVYSYTPAVSKKFSTKLGNTGVKYFEVSIDSFDEEGNKRTITLDRASIASEYALAFLDLAEAGDIEGSSLIFEGAKNSNLTYEDEII